MTHQVPDTVPAGDPPYTFITGGIEEAVAQARGAAEGKDVSLMGATIVQAGSVKLELAGVVDAPGVTHLTYRVLR